MIFYLCIFCFLYNSVVITSDQLDFQKIGYVWYNALDKPFERCKVSFNFEKSSLEEIASYYKEKYKIDIRYKDIDQLAFHSDNNFLDEMVNVVNKSLDFNSYKQGWLLREFSGSEFQHATMLMYIKCGDKKYFLSSDSLGLRGTLSYFCHNICKRINDVSFFIVEEARQASSKGCVIDALFWIKTLMQWSENSLIEFFINNSIQVTKKKSSHTLDNTKLLGLGSIDFQFTYYSFVKLPLLLLKTVQISKTRKKLCIERDKEACESLIQKYAITVKKDKRSECRNDFIRQKSWKLLGLLMALKYYDQDQGLFQKLKKIDGKHYITYENNTVGFDAKGFIEKIQTIKKEYKKKLVSGGKSQYYKVIFYQ